MRISDWSSDVCSSDLAALPLGQNVLDRMQAQLEESLRSADITGVQMTADGSPLEARAATTRSTRVAAQSLVETADGRFGFLDGENLEPVPGLSEAIESVDAVSGEASADLEKSEEHTSELQSTIRISNAVFCLET